MEMSKPTSYTFIEEYNGASLDNMQTTYNVDKPNEVSHIEHTGDKLENPVLNDKDAENLEPMYDLYGEPLDKMITDVPAVKALPAPSVLSSVAPSAAQTTAKALPEFTAEYKASLQANEVNTADTNLDNIALPDKDDPELEEFLRKVESAKPATTSTNYTYGGTSSYYASNYSNYSSNYSNYGYGRYGSNNYDYPSRRDNRWYEDYYDTDYEYPKNKSRRVDNKVSFSDETNAATVDSNACIKDTVAEIVKPDSEEATKELSELNELKDIMLTKFSTMVKLFTRTMQMVNDVKKEQVNIKKNQLQMSKEVRLLSHQMEYVVKTVNQLKNAFDNDGSDDGKDAHYGFYSDDDETSSDDLAKKGKFDNRVPKINDVVNL
ncbi:hypothetical protein F-VV10_0367 [Faustovirus]|nr:hypothetical protein F-VV10_0367 [Faustovirus]